MRELTPLCLLAKKHMTDKGGRHNLYDGNYTSICHEYTPVYWDMFNEIRHSVTRVLEIGVLGGCSLRMWKEFFPNAQIVGVDIEKRAVIGYRIWVFQGNQASRPELEAAAAHWAPYDLIIDDGSHEPSHQQNTIVSLLPYLKDGGFYVCEDIHCDVQDLINVIPRGYVYKVPITDPGINCANEKLLVIQHG